MTGLTNDGVERISAKHGRWLNASRVGDDIQLRVGGHGLESVVLDLPFDEALRLGDSLAGMAHADIDSDTRTDVVENIIRTCAEHGVPIDVTGNTLDLDGTFLIAIRPAYLAEVDE